MNNQVPANQTKLQRFLVYQDKSISDSPGMFPLTLLLKYYRLPTHTLILWQTKLRSWDPADFLELLNTSEEQTTLDTARNFEIEKMVL
jgi:hypothetical protein